MSISGPRRCKNIKRINDDLNKTFHPPLYTKKGCLSQYGLCQKSYFIISRINIQHNNFCLIFSGIT